MLPLWGHGTLQEGMPRVGVSDRGETSVISGKLRGFKLQRGNSRDLSQPLIANIHSLKEVKEGGKVDIEEKNQQDRLLGVNRELGDHPEGRVKFEGASQGYEFSSEESEGEENNREVEDDPPDSSSPEGRVKSEGASRGYEFSSEESGGEENNREVKDDPLDSSSPEGRVKCEGENPGYESSSEESVGEENNRDKRDTDESI